MSGDLNFSFDRFSRARWNQNLIFIADCCEFWTKIGTRSKTWLSFLKLGRKKWKKWVEKTMELINERKNCRLKKNPILTNSPFIFLLFFYSVNSNLGLKYRISLTYGHIWHQQIIFACIWYVICTAMRSSTPITAALCFHTVRACC